MTKVAFIGLGRMGHGMAGRYLDAGFTVAVWNRSKAKAEDLIARGARWAVVAGGCRRRRRRRRDHGRRRRGLARRLARQGRRRRNDEAGQRSRSNARPSRISTRSTWRANCAAAASSISIAPSPACRKRRLPGKLTLLVGADAADLDRAKPYLAPIGNVVRHFGAVGTGTVFKLINNLMGAVQIASLAEGIAMAEQAGLDMNLVAEALATGAVASPQVIRHSKRMVARDFSGASFTSALRHKDAAYAVKLAESLLADAPLVGRAAVEAYARAKAEMPDEDEGRMIEIVSRPK